MCGDLQEHDKQDAAEEAAAAALQNSQALALNGTPINGMHNPTALPSMGLHHSNSAGPAPLVRPSLVDSENNSFYVLDPLCFV
jgi:hypothetical protein